MTLDGLRVLVVDDAAEIRMLLRAVLELSGCTVTVTADGAAGLVAARALPDVLMLDVQLPDLDGPAVMQALREDPATADVPVVFLTAERGDDATLLASGARGVLHKPVDLATLPGQIAALLHP